MLHRLFIIAGGEVVTTEGLIVIQTSLTRSVKEQIQSDFLSLTWMASMTNSSWFAGDVQTLKKYLTCTSAVVIARTSATNISFRSIETFIIKSSSYHATMVVFGRPSPGDSGVPPHTPARPGANGSCSLFHTPRTSWSSARQVGGTPKWASPRRAF